MRGGASSGASDGATVPPWRLVGVVPAAGASRRMGRSKALLELEGDRFVERVVRALADGGCDPVVVTVAPDDDRVATLAAAAGADVVVNPDPGDGPLTSLRVVLRTRASEPDVAGVVYLPVDHPLVSPDVVRTLIGRWMEAGPGRDAPPPALALPLHEGERGHPALFGRALFDELLDPALEGGARTVVHRHLDRALLVDVDDAGVLADIDTPEAYRAVVEGAR